MPCDKTLSAQALFDGELDAPTAATVEQHIAGCAECAAQLESLKQTRAALREAAPYYRADAALRARVAGTLAKESGESGARVIAAFLSRSRGFLAGALSGGAGAALATALMMITVFAPANETLVADLTGAHLRSLMADHMFDVASSDHHTVKPWFAGHADVSPPVTDFAAQGYSLVGGRADYIDGHRAAVVVYRHGKHVINVFAWPWHEALPSSTERNGYHLVFWRAGDLAFAAVSDAGTTEIAGLERLIITDASSGNKTPAP